MESQRFRELVEADVRERELIPPGGAVTCLVSGGADSTCLWHALRSSYEVSALHVDHGLRGRESDEDAKFCLYAKCSAPRSSTDAGSSTEDELRELRYSFATDQLRATKHVSDHVETISTGWSRVARPSLDQVAARGRSRAPAPRPRP